MDKKLLIFSILHGPNINDLSPGSNSWYLKNYECYFEEVHHLSLISPKKDKIANGKSVYHFAGKGKSKIDFFLAPFRLYKWVRKIRPDYLVTYEQVWFWWSVFLVKWFTGRKVFLLPLTFPEQMYKVTGKAIVEILPIWLERRLLNLSYRICDKVITSENLGNYTVWMQENRIIRKKLLLTGSLPESVVFPAFMKRLNECRENHIYPQRNEDIIRLVYVGRVHVEKMTDHLIKALPLIRAAVPNVRLRIIGTGPDKDVMINLAMKLKVDDITEFLNYVPHGQLPDLLLSSDIFVSPSTGHAFREAAICGLPIVAYNMDWIKGFLVHKETFYGINEMRYEAFAEGVIDLCRNRDLQHRISNNIKQFAIKYWSSENLKASLEKLFQ